MHGTLKGQFCEVSAENRERSIDLELLADDGLNVSSYVYEHMASVFGTDCMCPHMMAAYPSACNTSVVLRTSRVKAARCEASRP